MKIKTRFNHWLPKFLEVEAITLYPFILFAYTFKEIQAYYAWTLKHEMQHVHQIRRDGWLRFYIIYIVEYLINLFKYRNHYNAYYHIGYEIEARSVEFDRLTHAEFNELFSQIKTT